jgi:hypothetical protein
MNSTIDFDVIAEQADLPSIMARSGVEVRNGKALCPFHSNVNTPAMTVFQVGGRWRFDCKGCGVKGDAITWVAEMEKIGLSDAARKLGGTEKSRPSRNGPGGSIAKRLSGVLVDSSSGGFGARGEAIRRFPEKPAAWESPEWQKAADDLVCRAEDRLWSPQGADALDWLRRRGLLDFTIRRFRLGFIKSDWERSGRLAAPRGITLPWCHPEAWYHASETPPGPRWVGCKIRRLASPDLFESLAKTESKCATFKDSGTGYPYPFADLTPGLPVIIAEGEWDALIAWQELGWIANVVTVGAAKQDPKPEALDTLLDCPNWLVALHNDAAGNEGSKLWDIRSKGKAIRLMLKPDVDLNDMHLAGIGLRDWLKSEFEDLGWTWGPVRG